MPDLSTILLILPPIITSVLTYIVTKKKNEITGDISKAKIDADIQTQALTIVQGVMDDLRTELKKEIEILRKENEVLKRETIDNTEKINTLEDQLDESERLIESLKSEIITLQTAVQIYKEENDRLKQQQG